VIVFSLGLSRLVPLLLWASVLLVAGRAAHDRLAAWRRPFARAAFVAIVAGGGTLALPYAVRSAFLVGALDANLDGRLEDALYRWSAYAELGGKPSVRTRHRWAESLIAVRRFGAAESVLLGGLKRRAGGVVRTEPDVILTLGVCRYYSGRWADAERTLRAVDTPATRCLKDYFLGRLAERRGDPSAAAALYEASLVANPRFFPAIYQRARLACEAGDAATATKLVGESRVWPSDAPALAALAARVARPAAPPPDHEFVIYSIR
jgi:hypothetical protein